MPDHDIATKVALLEERYAALLDTVRTQNAHIQELEREHAHFREEVNRRERTYLLRGLSVLGMAVTALVSAAWAYFSNGNTPGAPR